MKKILRSQKGFTLMELLVVVAILGVLMAVVGAAVTGTKSLSQDGQVKTDAKAVQVATDNYNNKSIASQVFPEETVSTGGTRLEDVYAAGAATDGSFVKLLDKTGAEFSPARTLASTITKSGSDDTVRKHNPIDFTDTTSTWDSTGAVKTSTYMPDFLLKEPSSLILKGDETKDIDSTDNTFEEYLWLVLVNAPGTDEESCTVEVYRMSAATCVGGSCDSADTGDGVTDLTYKQVF